MKYRFIVGIIISVGALGLVFLGREQLILLFRQGQHLRVQRQAANNELPRGAVIYTEDASQISALRNDPQYRRSPFRQGKQPERWTRKGRNLGIELREPAHSPVDRYKVGGVFGAKRTSANDRTWIVNLFSGSAFFDDDETRYYHLGWRTFEPVGWSLGARGAGVSLMEPKIKLSPSDRLTVFAPEADTVRADRVLVPYEINREKGRLAFTLRDNGTLVFEVLDGPARLVE